MRRHLLHLLKPQRPRVCEDLFDDYEESSASYRTAAPVLCETKDRLSLHFDVPGIQSAMDPADPTRLLLGYTRALMRFLEFHPHPRHIGMVGLGGGSLAKYCLHHLPQARMTVAEISPEIIALRDHFLVPPDSHRFQVLCEDGALFVNRHESTFDVLIIDGFDNTGQPPELCSPDFYRACLRALTPDGILAVNICDNGRSMLIPRLRRAFGREHVLVIDGEDSSNTIAFASPTNSLLTPK